MKRSEVIKIIANFVYELNVEPEECDEEAEKLLSKLEKAGLQPSRYVNPIAIEKGLDDPKWGYMKYIDMYPSHHFPDGRPFEYYLDGWEEEYDLYDS